MRIDRPCALLGGLTPSRFMRRHWQKRPLLVRGAVATTALPPLSRAALFALAASDEVESRLVVQHDDGRWSLRRGPLRRRALPPLAQPRWTLLVQGVDLHVAEAHELLQCFRFVPDARLDDLMISYATAGGGVGPHVDSYDVFLLQAHGVRRWRIAPPGEVVLRDDVPLKMLARIRPAHEWRLGPGDLLYLPPGWAHEGVADDENMTCSIGFRSPDRDELARELMLRLADAAGSAGPVRYRDARQPATDRPGRIPDGLQAFALDALGRALRDREAIGCALGAWLSEPKPQTWFQPGTALASRGAVRLDPRTRMLYDRTRLHVNGESHALAGRDARLLRELADRRWLRAPAIAELSLETIALLQQWAAAGWLHALDADDNRGQEGER